jgi:hypothetical protein
MPTPLKASPERRRSRRSDFVIFLVGSSNRDGAYRRRLKIGSSDPAGF